VPPPSTTYLIVLPWDVLPWDPRSAGGVNEVVRNLLRCIQKDGTWRPALLASSWDCRRPVALDGEPVLTVRSRLRNPLRLVGSVDGFFKALATTPRELHRLAGILTRHRVAVVNLHYATPAVWSFILVRSLLRRRFRLLLSFHGLDVDEIRNASRRERWLWARALAASDAVACCSEALARDLAELEPGARGRIAVVHNGIDPRTTFEDVAPAALPEALAGRDYVACVATYERKKGLDVLLRAFARLAGELPGVDLVLVGREESEHAAVEGLVDALGLRERVHLLTDVPHPVTLRILRAARALALPSRREPFGLVLLEAGVFGVPIVATRVGGIPEVVADGETGRLVPPDDDRALAEALARALRDDAESRRMADAMRERVLKHFSWDAAFAKYRALALGEPLDAARPLASAPAAAARPPGG
jgi:glycosyltransferase involved in cell wall biosynthesis